MARLKTTGTGGTHVGLGATELQLVPSGLVMLVHQLDEGEFGEVYRGQFYLENGNTQEVEVTTQLTHPNIMTIYSIREKK